MKRTKNQGFIAFLALRKRNFYGEIGMPPHRFTLRSAAQFLVAAKSWVCAKVSLRIAAESNKADGHGD